MTQEEKNELMERLGPQVAAAADDVASRLA